LSLLDSAGNFPVSRHRDGGRLGNAWNASIIAEYFHFQGRIASTTGLGSALSSASDAGRFDLLPAATLIMATIVVLINHLLWSRLYRLASTRFKLET